MYQFNLPPIRTRPGVMNGTPVVVCANKDIEIEETCFRSLCEEDYEGQLDINIPSQYGKLIVERNNRNAKLPKIKFLGSINQDIYGRMKPIDPLEERQLLESSLALRSLRFASYGDFFPLTHGT